MTAIEGDTGDGRDAVADASRVQAVGAALRPLGRGDGIVSVTPLDGGVVSDVEFVEYADGSRVVAKLLRDGPGDFCDAEVEGLTALAETETVEVPRILGSTDRVLLLEPLPRRVDEDAAWEAFAHDLAALHRQTVHGRIGWSHDGYCAMLRQFNGWTTDGHAFSASTACSGTSTSPQPSGCSTQQTGGPSNGFVRGYPKIVPSMPPVLTHGDLWDDKHSWRHEREPGRNRPCGLLYLG